MIFVYQRKGVSMCCIEIRKVSKAFGKKVLYQDVDLFIKEGTTVGIVGVNGSGKSVLFQLIAGLKDVDDGEILVRGKKVGRKEDFPEQVGLLVSQAGYVEMYDGFTNLQMLAEIQGKISEATICSYMQKFGLDPTDKTKVKNYSMGMRQKLGLIQATMEGQTLLLLDEVFNGLDFQTSQEIFSFLKEEKKNGKTILLTSHQHDCLEKLCDEIYLIDEKKLVLLTEEKKKKYFSF